jgi:hypothetical protein
MHAKPLDQYNSQETTGMHACMSEGDVVNVDGLTFGDYPPGLPTKYLTLPSRRKL